MKQHFIFALAALWAVFAPEAQADGIAEPWQLYFQPPQSPVMEGLYSFHNLLMFVITAITIFVLVLLAYTCYRFSEKRNKTPSKTTHHTLLEVVWTTIPLFIIIGIAFPSCQNLYNIHHPPEADMTLKVVGYQWYWNYEYPDYKNLAFDSYMIQDKDLKPGQLRLLEVDNRIVLPVDKVVRVQITAADVIHSWAMPSLGVKTDAVPGKLNETWLQINKPGVYYGQCSELCGVLHGFMPIVIEAVTQDEFEAWIASKKNGLASNDNAKLAEIAQ